MILLQSPTAWQKLLLSCAIWLLNTYSLASSICKESTASFTDLKQYSDAGDLKRASKCGLNLLKKHPSDWQIFSQTVRIFAWEKEFETAIKLLKKWKDKDEFYYVLFGDIFWYQGNCQAAIKYYEKGLTSSKDYGDNSYLSYFKCLNKLEKGMTDSQSGNTSFAKSQFKLFSAKSQNKALVREIDTWMQSQTDSPEKLEVSKFRAIGNFSLFKESHNRSLEHRSLAFINQTQHWSALLEGGQWQRRIYDVSLQASYIDLALTYSANQYELTLGYLARFPNSDDFYPLRRTLASGKYWIAPTTAAGVEANIRKYSGEKNLIFAAIFAEHYFSNYLISAKVFGNTEDARDKSILLQMAHDISRWQYSLWTASGRGEAQRSYLTEEELSHFLSVGLRVTLKVSFARLWLGHERRWEESYYHRMLQLGGSWTF